MIDKFYNMPFPNRDLNEHFLIREQSHDDAEIFYRYYNDPDVCRYILATPPTSIEESHSEIDYGQSLFRHRRGIYWTLARKDNNQMIGTLGFYINNFHHRAEMFYEMDKAYWRKGIMTKALEAIIDIGFKQIGLHRIEAVNLKENIASTAILKKLNFSHDGTLRNYRYHKGAPHTVEMYSLVSTAPNN